MLRWWKLRKMRWAVRLVASLTARERERLFRQHSTNRMARRMDRLIGKMYTSARFSAYPKMAGYDDD